MKQNIEVFYATTYEKGLFAQFRTQEKIDRTDSIINGFQRDLSKHLVWH